MKPRRKRAETGRPAISGIIAALILFVMLFTVGTGYFLWISANNGSYSQALAGRGTALQNQQEENLNVTATAPGGELEFSVENTGGIAVNVTNLFVTLPSEVLNTYGLSFTDGSYPNPPLPLFLSVGVTISSVDTGINTTLQGPGTYTLKLLTERGNVFVATYTQPAPAISTQLQPSSTVTVGAIVTDTAILTGVSTIPGGSVQYQYFADATCTGTSTPAGDVAVTAGPYVPGSVAVPFNSAGQFSWDANYSDSPNPSLTSHCEPLTVQAMPTISTTLSTSLAAVNGQVSDTATIVGGSTDPNPGGYVTYYFSSTDTCPNSGATEVGEVEVVDGVAAPSSPYTFTSAGYYYWYAVYSGDQYNVGATSPCEQLTVGTIPTITTTLAASSIGLGVSTYDSATISGATSNPGCSTNCATVTFYFSSTPNCPATSGATEVGTPVKVLASENGVYTSSTVPMDAQGTYYWYAVYSGDTYNVETTSPCETMTVGTAITTTLSQGTILTGWSVYDQGQLEPPDETGSLTGTVTYYYFSGSSCSGPSTNVNTVTVVGGLVPPSNGVIFPTAGPFSWDAVYIDSPNPSLTSPCEPLSVISSASSNSPPSPIGSLAEVLGSFKFYFTTCNNATSGEYGDCLGDGVNVGGYYGYGLSMASAGSDCPSYYYGGNPSCVNVVFQITLTNTDPTRAIKLGPQSMLWLQGTCQTAEESGGRYYFFRGHCGTNPFTQPLSNGYWIANGPVTDSNGEGALPQPYTNPIVIAPGAKATLYFYCAGPCTNELLAPTYNPPPGTYVEASLNLYGNYSDNTPFGQSIPFIASYISPVEITGCAEGTSYPGPTCWPSPTSPELVASAGSSVTLAVDGFPCTSVTVSGGQYGEETVSCASGDSFPIYVEWVNSAGVVSQAGANPSCLYSTQSAEGGYCTVTFTVPPDAVGGPYAVYVTSDGVNNAYATVYVTSVPVLTTQLEPSSTVEAGTPVHDTASLIGVTPTAGGTVTYYYTTSSSCSSSGATDVGSVTVSGGSVPNSPSHTFTTGEMYYWFAVYSGDANNPGADSPCEPLQVMSLTVSPTSGPIGTVTTLSGSGYTPSTTYYYCLSTSASAVSCVTTASTFTSSATGAIPSGVIITIPPGTASGPYSVIVYQGTTVLTSATFTVTTPTLSVSPSSGPAGTTTTLTGSGYTPATSYSDCLSSSSTTVSCIAGSTSSFTSSGAGAIPTGTAVVVPSGTATGSYFVIVYQGTNVVSSATFTVTSATLSISPTQGPYGTSTTLSGSGYGPSTLYSDCLSTSATSVSCVPGSTSSFTSSTTGTIPGAATVTVPSHTSAGTYYVIVYTGTTVFSSATFTVTTATITLSPTQGPVGTSVTVTGTGFSVSTTIGTFTFNGAAPATQSCIGTLTSTTGGFSCTFTVPSSTTGSKTVVASGSDVGTVAGDTASATFTVTATTLTVTPSSGPVGTSVTLSGSGYVPSTVYAYCFSSSSTAACPSGTATTFTSTSGGAIPTGITITVPSSGNAYVDVNQGNTGTNFIISASFTVTTPRLTLAPTSGPIGITVTLSGSGYAPSTVYAYCFSSSSTAACPSGTATTFTSTSGGAIPTGITITVPSSGNAYVDVNQGNTGTNFIISASFTVTKGLDPNTSSTNIAEVASGTTATTLTISTTNANDLIFACEYTVDTGITQTISATGLTWTQTGSTTSITTNHGEVTCWTATAASALSSESISFGTGGATSGGKVVLAYAVTGGSLALDGTAHFNTGASGTSSSVTFTTADSPDVLVGAVFTASSEISITAGTGYASIDSTTGSAPSGGGEDALVTTTGSQTVAFTWSYTSSYWISVGLAIDPPSVGISSMSASTNSGQVASAGVSVLAIGFTEGLALVVVEAGRTKESTKWTGSRGGKAA